MHKRMKASSGLCVSVFDGDYAAAHSLTMHDYSISHEMRDLLPAMLKAVPGGTQDDLAKFIGVSQPDISRWLSGSEPRGQNYVKIKTAARKLGLDTDDVSSEDVAAGLPAPPEPKMVKLKGYVGATDEAVYYRLADEDLEEVEAPSSASDQTVAVEIRGKSLGRLLQSWLVFYDDVRSPITPDLFGHLCVVGLADDRILIKQIERNGRGGYNLLSNTGDNKIENAQIEWAAKVTSMRPR